MKDEAVELMQCIEILTKFDIFSKMNSQRTYDVALLRRNGRGEWLELNRNVRAIVSSSGLVIRELSGALIADFPIVAVKIVTQSGSSFIDITFGEHGDEIVVLKMVSATEVEHFKRNLTQLNFQVSNRNPHTNGVQNSFPNLKDPRVQEFIVNILFSDGFKDFASDLKGMLSSIETNIKNLQK